MYKQTFPIPLVCSLTNLHVLQLHVVFSFILCYSSPILRVLYIPHVLCLSLGSHYLVFCLSLVSPRPGRFLAFLSLLIHNAHENPQSSVFSFFSTRGLRYHFFILSYLETCPRPFLFLDTPANIRHVFANTPTSRQ